MPPAAAGKARRKQASRRASAAAERLHHVEESHRAGGVAGGEERIGQPAMAGRGGRAIEQPGRHAETRRGLAEQRVARDRRRVPGIILEQREPEALDGSGRGRGEVPRVIRERLARRSGRVPCPAGATSSAESASPGRRSAFSKRNAPRDSPTSATCRNPAARSPAVAAASASIVPGRESLAGARAKRQTSEAAAAIANAQAGGGAGSPLR
jgi:hypothetical protein